jgi:hypothetical protein
VAVVPLDLGSSNSGGEEFAHQPVGVMALWKPIVLAEAALGRCLGSPEAVTLGNRLGRAKR